MLKRVFSKKKTNVGLERKSSKKKTFWVEDENLEEENDAGDGIDNGILNGDLLAELNLDDILKPSERETLLNHDYVDIDNLTKDKTQRKSQGNESFQSQVDAFLSEITGLHEDLLQEIETNFGTTKPYMVSDLNLDRNSDLENSTGITTSPKIPDFVASGTDTLSQLDLQGRKKVSRESMSDYLNTAKKECVTYPKQEICFTQSARELKSDRLDGMKTLSPQVSDVDRELFVDVADVKMPSAAKETSAQFSRDNEIVIAEEDLLFGNMRDKKTKEDPVNLLKVLPLSEEQKYQVTANNGGIKMRAMQLQLEEMLGGKLIKNAGEKEGKINIDTSQERKDDQTQKYEAEVKKKGDNKKERKIFVDPFSGQVRKITDKNDTSGKSSPSDGIQNEENDHYATIEVIHPRGKDAASAPFQNEPEETIATEKTNDTLDPVKVIHTPRHHPKQGHSPTEMLYYPEALLQETYHKNTIKTYLTDDDLYTESPPIPAPDHFQDKYRENFENVGLYIALNGRKTEEENKLDRSKSTSKLKVTFADENDEKEGKRDAKIEKRKSGEIEAVSEDSSTDDYLSVTSEDSALDIEPRRMAIRRTVVLFLGWIIMGLCLEIPQPLLPFLKNLTSGTGEEVSRGLGGRGLGFVLGAYTGGLLHQMLPLYRDVWLTLGLVLSAASSAAVPFLSENLFLILSFSFQGLGLGFFAVGSLSTVVSIYTSTVATERVTHALFVGQSIGRAGAPLLSQLFMEYIADFYKNGAAIDTRNSTLKTASVFTLFGKASKVQISRLTSQVLRNDSDGYPAFEPGALMAETHPFVAVAVAFLFCTLLSLLLFTIHLQRMKRWCPTVKERRLLREDLSPKTWFTQHTCNIRTLFALLVYLILPVAVTHAYSTYLYHYQMREVLWMQVYDHTLLITLFWAASVIGRCVIPLFTICIAPNAILLCCFTLNIISGSLVLVYGWRSNPILWGFTGVLGFSSSPFIPAAFTWGNVYINLTPMGVAFALSAYGLGLGVFSWMTEFLLGLFGHACLIYFSLAAAGAGFLTYIPLIPSLAKASAFLAADRRMPPKSAYV